MVLTPQSWRLRWQQYKAHRGERVISRKAIAQGMSDCLRCPVCSCAHFLPNLRMRPRVQRASGSPCALWIGEGGKFTCKARAQCAARMRSHIRCRPRGVRNCARGRGPSIPETPIVEPRGRGVLGPPLSRAMTVEYVAAISRRIAPEVCWKLPALSNPEGAGNAGCALHPRSHAQVG